MSRLVRNAYKSVASGLKYHTFNQRLLKSADNYKSRYGELSKVAVYFRDSSCTKTVEEAQEVLQMATQFRTAVEKVFDDYKHFKLHEEPILSSMIRGYVLPSAAAATLGVLVAEIAYRKQLKEEYLAIERELSAESAN
ncbi:uncharacterized protein LOC113343159 isoform X2 [Papaver somniferum]|nr:uncharacterized protein LOC113334124 isoform X2 [Papaver somniferum]XP_026436260.1 uncharacterized protein LOC113334124 isoform X2 [Papaver somniferum]XP_026443231.1 uncharacterized protein LOC113343159 isoform X2 [Papaver somniferum]XP_026443232.1 uncharacterized protein LOC113343159 isoform X2 [Papaver somniferum]